MGKITIAIDAMGGDHGPEVSVPAARLAVESFSDLHILLFGEESLIKPFLAKTRADCLSRIEIIHTDEQILMDDSPVQALRRKRNSSMHLALQSVKDGRAQACVSAGNTGALMAISKYLLNTLPGVDRPAIIYSVPGEDPSGAPVTVRMLDLGANVECTATHLHQFAIMGSILAKAAGIVRPRVGLLNIGQEIIKGNDTIKQASQLLSETSDLNYIGYVEGTQLMTGVADVIVCDGFVGNIALKTMEGTAGLLLKSIKRGFSKNWYTRMLGLMAKPVFKALKRRFDPELHNGASLLGLNGVVIKSHGNVGKQGYFTAILEAKNQGQQNVPDLIRSEIAAYFS